MRKAVTVFLLLALTLVIVLSNGCAGTTDIGEITTNPAQYEGKEVTIKGTASNSFWLSLLTRGAYKVTDNTGSIWVVCSHTSPEKNEEVKVRGMVESAVRIGDRSLGIVVIETSRD